MIDFAQRVLMWVLSIGRNPHSPHDICVDPPDLLPKSTLNIPMPAVKTPTAD